MAESEAHSEDKKLFDAESYQNHPDIEMAWLGKAVEHMNVHFNLVTSVDPKCLKLTQYDDEICDEFKKMFPDFKVDVLDEESLKSEKSREKWRNFCNLFVDKIDTSTYGTLVRIDCKGDYNDKNTILVLRIQFLAIEIARNRNGYNDSLREKYKQEENEVSSST